MPCFNLQTGYRSKVVNPETGKRSIVFSPHEGFADLPIKLPCGWCMGCRLARSQMWAARCVHEAQLWKDNCFVTLTYNDEHLPPNGSLNPNDVTLFFKRLRRQYGQGVRYYYCGEYGERFTRPHYHLCLFNFNFPDRRKWKSHNGYRYDRSAALEALWTTAERRKSDRKSLGFSSVGDLTFESAAYVARYVTKKIVGRDAIDHYTRIDSDTGEIITLEPEFTRMSRDPGIASEWYSRYKSDVFPADRVTLLGKKVRHLKPPKYYDAKFDIEDPAGFAKIKARRQVRARQEEKKGEFSRDRMEQKEICMEQKYLRLKRSYEDGQ